VILRGAEARGDFSLDEAKIDGRNHVVVAGNNVQCVLRQEFGRMLNEAVNCSSLDLNSPRCGCRSRGSEGTAMPRASPHLLCRSSDSRAIGILLMLEGSHPHGGTVHNS
jgi:hypothetical protein